MSNISNQTLSICAERVTFRYRRRAPWALASLDLHLDSRPTVLIGPNGAGKSTLLRLLARQLRPTSGKVNAPDRIGYSAQHPAALPGFSVEEQVRYASWLAGVSRTDAEQECRRALDMTSLTGLASRPATRLSGGELARLGIACALASSPQYLLLDEPTASLDPLARQAVTSVLADLASAGVGLVVSSHTATDVRPPFERLIVLDNGEVHFDGPLHEFFAGRHSSQVVANLAQALRDR
jgi:ABC-2 type transport system ATP-binding protein